MYVTQSNACSAPNSANPPTNAQIMRGVRILGSMEGKVRWSKEILPEPAERYKFDRGVKLIVVEDKPVAKTIHYDKEYRVPWSIVLESVFGGFKKIARGKLS